MEFNSEIELAFPWMISWESNAQQGIRMEGDDSGDGSAPTPTVVVPPTTEPPASAAPPEPSSTAASGTEPAPEPAPAATSEPTPAPGPDWRARQLAKKNSQIAELRAELAAVKQNPNPGPGPGPNPGPGSAEYNNAIRREALRLNAAEAAAKQSNEVVSAGRTKYVDFDARVNQFKTFFDPADPVSAQKYSQIIEAAMETGDGADVLYALGSEPEEAEKLLDMTPGRMAVALMRLGEKAKAKGASTPVAGPNNALSLAPTPIRPVTPSGPTHEPIDPSDPKRQQKLPIGTWMERRNAQALAEAQRRGDYRATRVSQTRH